MEKLETETQVQNVACDLWPVNWSGCAPVQLHNGGREQLNLGVTERGQQTLNTHEVLTPCNQIKVSKIKVTGGGYFFKLSFVIGPI